MAARLALGATRARLARQFLVESLLLGFIGGCGGLLLAWAGVKLFVATSPFDIWQLERVGIDGRVLLFTVTVSLLASLSFGVIPAWHASRLPLAELREGSRSVTGTRSEARMRELLVTVEVALALILLLGAGLMTRSLRQLQKLDLGFSTERLLTFKFSLPGLAYPSVEKMILFHQQLLERVAALPGVSAAGATFEMFGDVLTTGLEIEGQPLSNKDQEIAWAPVSSSFFPMMGVSLRRGRVFASHDQSNVQPVVMVNEAMAKRFLGDRDLASWRIRLSGMMGDWDSVIGVAADFRRFGPDSEVGPEVYVPAEQFGIREGQVFVRTSVDPLSIATALRERVRELDRRLPIQQLQTLEQQLLNMLAPRYYSTLLLGLFAALALPLAAVGIYGVLSYQVRQRAHEFGVRLALGAQPRDIIVLVLKRGLIIGLVGLAIGLAAAIALARFASGLLVGVGAFDPLNLVTVALVLLAVTMLASYLPARRATKLQPVVALRSR